MNGNFNRSSKTLSAVEVDLQLGHRGRGEISFASTQTETEETSKEETEVSEKISLQTEDREVQTEEIEKEKEKEAEEKPQVVEEISKEEKEIQTTLTETVSLTESSCQTEEICRDEIARQNSVEICLGTTTPLDEKGEEGGRTSACTQTLVEGVCSVSVEVQTDIDQEDGQIEYRGGQRPPTYPGSPGTELVNFI